jgi:NAD(P)-dependent dehydrogenase (short-subunit alcohol dehydrogenase family)
MIPEQIIRGLDVPANALVTGASSGIGLALVTALLAHAQVAQVIAVSRSAERNDALALLIAEHGDRLVRFSADITRADDLAELAIRVAATTDRLHLIYNTAGILHAPGMRPEKSVLQLNAETLAQVFALNAFAPILLARALLPCLKHTQPSVLASLSARVGSIGDNQLGGWYAYRASKAAQNQLYRTLAVELRRTHPNTTCVLLHPGTVDTPLSLPFQSNVPAEKLFTPARAARHLLDIVAALNPSDSGRFIAWDGRDIPW